MKCISLQQRNHTGDLFTNDLFTNLLDIFNAKVYFQICHKYYIRSGKGQQPNGCRSSLTEPMQYNHHVPFRLVKLNLCKFSNIPHLVNIIMYYFRLFSRTEVEGHVSNSQVRARLKLMLNDKMFALGMMFFSLTLKHNYAIFTFLKLKYSVK